MLRTFVFAVFLTPVFASEDLSLMQQSSLTVSRTSAQEIRTAIQNLDEKLREVPNSGKVRQMAIDALMREVTVKTEIDDAAKSLLDDIVVLLDQILTSMRDSKTGDQNALNAIAGVIAACSSQADIDDDEARENASDTAHTEHSDCRAAERGLYEDKDTKCMSLTGFLSGVQAGEYVCVAITTMRLSIPECNQDGVYDSTCAHHHDFAVEWEKVLSAAKTDSKADKERYEELAGPCQLALSALSSKTADCDSKQVSFETKFCTWRYTRIERCSSIETCGQNARDDHNELINGHTGAPGIKANSDQRVREARVIIHIRCLVLALKEGTTDPATCEQQTADNETSIQSNYNVTYPTVPDDADCDASDTVFPLLPGEAGWAAAMYPTASQHTYEEGGVLSPSGVQCLGTNPGHNQ